MSIGFQKVLIEIEKLDDWLKPIEASDVERWTLECMSDAEMAQLEREAGEDYA